MVDIDAISAEERLSLIGDLWAGVEHARSRRSMARDHRRAWQDAAMTLQEIKQAIDRLQPSEFAELIDWIVRRDAALGDEQIVRDSEAGKLDAAIAQANADHHKAKAPR
jgi:hypothetical protein